MNRKDYHERVKALLYMLMRDKLPTADVVLVVNEIEKLRHKEGVVYTAKGLAEYASELADRVLREPPKLPDNSRDAGGDRINCTLCGKALEGGHERDSYDWCECICCEHCDKRFRARKYEEDGKFIQELCPGCIAKGVALNANGDPYMIGASQTPTNDAELMDSPSDTENLYTLTRLTGRRWAVMSALLGTNARGYSTLIMAPALSLVVYRNSSSSPWIVQVRNGDTVHMLADHERECLTVEMAIRAAGLSLDVAPEPTQWKEQSSSAEPGPYDGTSPLNGLRRRMLFLASDPDGTVAAFPADAGELRRALRTVTPCQIRDVWPDHGNGPEWWMANGKRKPDHGVMVLDLAFQGRVCTVARLREMGMWQHDEQRDE